MPAKRRGPFRTVGMRMQAFGRSLMRHYAPPQNLPSGRSFTPPPPAWQSDAQTPLIWNEPEEQIPLPPVEALPDELSTVEITETAPLPARPVQRAPIRPKEDTEEKIDPRLLAILAAHQERETYAARVREERKASAASEIQRQPDEQPQPNTQPAGHRRSRASFDYVETKALLPPDEEIGHTAPPKAPPADAIQPARLPDQPDRDDEEDESSPPGTSIQQSSPTEENKQPASAEPAALSIIQRSVQPSPIEDIPAIDADEAVYSTPVPPEITPVSSESVSSAETPVQHKPEAVQSGAPLNTGDIAAPSGDVHDGPPPRKVEQQPDRLASQPPVEPNLVQRETAQPRLPETGDDLPNPPDDRAGDQIITAPLEPSADTPPIVQNAGDTLPARSIIQHEVESLPPASPVNKEINTTLPQTEESTPPVKQQAERAIFPAVKSPPPEPTVIQRQVEPFPEVDVPLPESQSGVGEQIANAPLEPSADTSPIVQSAGDTLPARPIVQREVESLPPASPVNKELDRTPPQTESAAPPVSQQVERPIFPVVESPLPDRPVVQRQIESVPPPAAPIQPESERRDKAEHVERAPLASAMPVEPMATADQAVEQGEIAPLPSADQLPLEKSAKTVFPLPTVQRRIESVPPDVVLPVSPVENREAEIMRQPEPPEADEPPESAPPDVFQALVEANMVTPPESKPIEITREPAPEADEPPESAPPDVFQALVGANMVAPPPESKDIEIMREPAPEADEPTESTQPDVFQAMVEAGMVRPPPGSKRPEIARKPAPQVSQPPVSHEPVPDRLPVHYATQPDTIQRVETASTEQTTTPSEQNSGGEVDVDKLARDVYSVLRTRLRIEKERRG
jgi:hypothetical protein